MSDFDPIKDTQTEAVKARFDQKGVMWDKRNLEKLVLTLLEQRDWHQSDSALRDLAMSTMEEKIKLMEQICESYYEWEWGENLEDEHPKAFLLKKWKEEYSK